MERRLRAAVAEWRVALSRQVAQARQIVTKLIDGRWTVTPEEKDGVRGFRLVAMGSFAKLIAVTVPALSTLQTLASLSIPSWNQIAGFLRSIQRLRDSFGFAA
jgi:hypothetical protein